MLLLQVDQSTGDRGHHAHEVFCIEILCGTVTQLAKRTANRYEYRKNVIRIFCTNRI